MSEPQSKSSEGTEPAPKAPDDVVDSGSLPRDSEPPSEPPPPAQQGAAKAVRMLIVDDDERVCRALQRVFRDYDVVAHTTGREVVERIVRGERFDVILSDVAMPQMTGWELYDEIQDIDPEQARRVIFITGGARDSQTEWFLASCGQPVVGKPCNPSELRDFVKAFVS